MGMTAAEKILAAKSGLASVRPGDIVYPIPDWIYLHDNFVMTAKRELDALGIDKLFDPDRVMMTSDHDVIYVNERALERGVYNRKAARDWGIKHFYDAGRGGHGHVFPMEEGLVLPGMFYFDDDRHCTNVGGIGALAFRVGEEISTVLATGTVWTRVPHSVRLTVRGKLQPGVYARDLGFKIAQGLKVGGFFGIDIDYRILEFAGDIEQFSLAARVSLCSSPTEMRALGVFFPPSEAILEHARARAQRPFTPVESDPDARFEAEIEIDVSNLEPQVALPGGPFNAADIGSVAGTPVDHAFIGSCGSGMWEDIAMAASILQGHRIAPGVRLFVTPGSEQTTRRMHKEGLFETFMDAGAIILPAGCGVCAGGRMGPVTNDEVSISTAVDNATGRMGARSARLFLGNPATVAASAIAGKITDPRSMLRN
jgi:3-isopropylmalate/(R)-2-methylmalate dehydratase large subunit